MKDLLRLLLQSHPVRFIYDIGKPIPLYPKILNSCTPSWSKHRGVFGSFEEARANVGRGLRIGYDHPEAAEMYMKYLSFVLPGDYPTIFWLREALQSGSRVFDFGGNLGISFYAFQKYLRYPEGIRWVICDVPAVIEAGRRLATKRQEKRLSFVSRFGDAEGCDTFLCSGTLQFVETPLRDLLQPLRQLPRCLLINRIPLHDSRECFTLHNNGVIVSPYHIFQKDRFIAEIESVGYKLEDLWTDATHYCMIPFYPEYSVSFYSGLFFTRRSA